MVSQDFSFPKITNSSPQFTISSSLWHASSLVFPSFDDNFLDNSKGELDLGRNSSFSCPETSEEDKMDMLWEDFNDKELQRVCSKEKNKNREAKPEKLSERENNTMVVEFCCMEALKISKRGTGGGIIQHHLNKRQSMGVVVKVLIRKLFSTNNSSRRFNKKYCLWSPKSGI
ncbi:hypothetical protein HS088_TW02G00776 [Tripterygium wilfordii]|uniref:Uncharacterized protein n=1 Tax=Tripterygium wilfordii TaxID=458696 RepID=A0A7J7DZH2_TRIWF|nr:hypothetical protein HS088_TW02G00776 [Tripterygium wilfordii]